MSTEHDIQAGILDYLRRIRRVFCWRNNSGAFKVGDRFFRAGMKGSPDIIGLLPDGRFLGVEVKAPGKKPTPEQHDFLDSIRTNNGVAIVAHSLEELIAGLDAATIKQ